MRKKPSVFTPTWHGSTIYAEPMAAPKPESKLVRLLMPDASVAEIEEATQRWFSFLETLNEIVIERERRAADSSESARDDRVRDIDGL